MTLSGIVSAAEPYPLAIFGEAVGGTNGIALPKLDLNISNKYLQITSRPQNGQLRQGQSPLLKQGLRGTPL